ncbi:retrovirus-related pol polyprotein from transposon TNT 1-94 [Tanacetum coccineum]
MLFIGLLMRMKDFSGLCYIETAEFRNAISAMKHFTEKKGFNSELRAINGQFDFKTFKRCSIFPRDETKSGIVSDEEIEKKELEAHYGFMAKIQEVLPAESSSTHTPLEQVQNNDEKNVFANERQHSEKHAAECADERVALVNLIAKLTLDTEENKTILKQLKKANASLTQELEECKTNLDETSRALGEATSSRDSCLIALQTKQTELEKYTALNDRTSDYKILQTKLNETLGLLALKDIDIQQGLKTKTYEISVVNQKHDELVKKSLLTRSQFEGQLKEKSKVISDLKVKEGRDIDKMIAMDKQIKFLNEILYKRNQSIQTIHMLAPKCATYNGRSTFANPKYLKIAQFEKPRLYEISYDTSDPANRFCPNGEETVTLEKESRSKLDKDKVKPYDYTYQNSLYETFKPPSKTYLDQLERAKEVRKTMWRKTFVRTKPNIAKNVAFLPISKSISKSRQLYNEMTNNFNHFRTICQQTWSNHTNSAFPNPTAKTMEVLIKTLLMPLSNKTILDSHCFVHELKKEMHDDLEYVKSLEKEIDELESEKADFSNIYDLLLEEFQRSECLAQKLSKQTENYWRNSVNKGNDKYPSLQKKMLSKCISKRTVNNIMKYKIESSNARQAHGDKYKRKLHLLKCYQVKDKVVPNNSQVKFQKKEVEDHHRISSISKKTKSVTACNDSSNSRTSNANAVCAECGTCVFNSNHDACVSRYLKDIVQLILFIVDSGCTKHMTGNLKLLCNFMEKFLGTVRFGNDQFAPILGYGDLIQGNVTIKWVYYVEGLNHNLFSVGQFCDAGFGGGGLPFRKSTDQLCSSCEMSKAKRSSFKSKAVPSSKGRLNLLHMDLCGPMRVASINGKKYILVIVDDYSRYTWTLFLRSKDETPEVLKDFL